MRQPSLKLAVAAFVVAGLTACPSPSAKDAPALSSGTIALSQDGSLVYAVSPDHGTLSVVDARSLEPIRDIQVGAWPSRVIVGPDDRIYVANRGSRSISVIEGGTWSVSAEIAVGAEPVGLALSDDGARLFVTSQESGEIAAIDTGTLTERWRTDLGRHPRAVAFADGRLLVTHFRTGEVSVLDADSGLPRGAPISLTQDSDVMRSAFRTALEAGQPAEVVVAPGASRAFVVHTQARAEAISDEPTFDRRGGGSVYGSDPTLPVVVPAVASGVGTVDVDGERLLDEPTPVGHVAGPADAAMPPSVVASDGSAVLNQPSAAVVDASGEWLYVTFQGSDNLAIISTKKREGATLAFPGVYAVVDTNGQFPTGVALSPDNTRAYVHNAHSYSISVIERVPGATRVDERLAVTATRSIQDAPEWMTPEVQEGRRLFFAANDVAMTDPSTVGLSCASCHPDGRDDGRTWLFPEGPRQTHSLASGFLGQTAPFHWAGEMVHFSDFQSAVTDRMGGSGLSNRQWDNMLAFLESPAVMPVDNPHRPLLGEGLTDQQAHGKALFEGVAGCASCHAGGLTTDNAAHDVGTFTRLVDPHTQIVVEDMSNEIVTPTLRNVYSRGPWLHTGEAKTLRELIVDFARDERGNEVHGQISELSATDIDALVAYVETL